MSIFDIFIVLLGIGTTLYAVPYGNYVFKNKNKTSASIIYMIALVGLTLSILQCFFQK